MKGIVWYYSDKERGKEKLKTIINEYKKLGINATVFAGVNTCDTQFENGDRWKIAFASDSARGSCCNISYIERCTPTEIIECVIKPCTKAFPYRAFNYYGEVDFNESELRGE